MVGVRLNELLEARGRSLLWLANETGIAYSTLWKLRDAKTKAVYFDVLDKICRALDCQPGDLLVHVPEKRSSHKK